MPPVPKLIVRELADCRVLHYLRERQGEPCHVMQMLNVLTKLDRPRNRKERRRSFGWHLERLPILLREGIIRRCGRKHVIILAPGQALPPRPSPVGPRRAEVDYAKRLAIEARLRTLAVHRRDAPTVVLTPSNEPKTESAGTPVIPVPASPAVPTDPAPQPPQHLVRLKRFLAIRVAARALPRSPKNTHWLTGWLDDRTRLRHKQPVLTPEGETMLVVAAKRGEVLVMTPEEAPLGVSPFRLLQAHEVRIAKNQHAVLLGSLKRGVREKPSKRKAEAARRNGCCPCRPGKKRGRPATFRSTQPMRPPAPVDR